MDNLRTLLCGYCGHRYKVHNGNSRLYGPVIHTTCPSCNKLTKRNFGKMVDQQGRHRAGSIEDAAKLIHHARVIERVLR